MTDEQLKIINKHLKGTNSGWFDLLDTYTDGSFLILHGTGNRQYTKLLSSNERVNNGS